MKPLALAACCVLVAGPARAGEAPAEVDTSSFWFPWQGVLIGAVAGGAGGYLLARSTCGSGGTVLSCDGLAVAGSISIALVGGLVGGLVQALFFWPQPSAPVSLLPSISVDGSTSLTLKVRF